MSKKRSFFERLTGSMTLSNKHKFDDDDDADQNSKKSITAKLTPLNSEHKNKHHLKDGDDSDAEIKNTITKGKADTVMAGFEGRLSSAEIDALVQFVKKPAP